MGVQHTFGTAGATGGGWSAQPGTLQPSLSELRHEPRWSWQARGPKTNKDRNNWISRWSFGCRVSGGDLEGYNSGCGDLSEADPFEPFSCDGAGTQSMNFIKGTCYLNDGTTPAANAIVQGFRTSDDAFVGEVQANTDGTYTLGTQNGTGVAHYLIAYKPGSPDIAGTTVNTLTPTRVDGT